MIALIKSFGSKFINVVIENGIDWIVTAIITYFTVKHATRQYYNRTKVMVAKNTMEQGLRAVLKLNYNEELPDNAKVIFVEYKGRCYNLKKLFKKKEDDKECIFFEKIRKTVASVGGDTMGVSSYRPREYGVLGVANILMKPVLFNFQSGEMYKYDGGNFIKLETKQDGDKYKYISSNKKEKELSEKDSARDVMIAIPVVHNEKLVGGLTFDMEIGAKTIYQNILASDSNDEKTKKKEDNTKVMKEVRRTANNLVNAYFKKKGEDVL